MCKKDNIFPSYSKPGYCDACADKVKTEPRQEVLPRLSIRRAMKSEQDEFKIDAYLSLEEHEKKLGEIRARLVTIKDLSNCGCSIADRASGHKTYCYLPNILLLIEEALEIAR